MSETMMSDKKYRVGRRGNAIESPPNISREPMSREAWEEMWERMHILGGAGCAFVELSIREGGTLNEVLKELRLLTQTHQAGQSNAKHRRAGSLRYENHHIESANYRKDQTELIACPRCGRLCSKRRADHCERSAYEAHK